LIQSSSTFSWYSLVPKELTANLKFREEMIRYGNSSKDRRTELWMACSRDLLFWVNTFVWTFDAMGTYNDTHKPKRLPFITYDCQDTTLLELDNCIGREHVAIEKSRDMGASWMVITLFTWHFDFHRDYKFLIASRKVDLVDKGNDPDTLFWKIDFIHRHVPKWLRPPFVLPKQNNRTNLSIYNETLDSKIDGDTTTGNIARGGRRAAIMVDEFAAVALSDGFDILHSVPDATQSCFYNSTHKGSQTAFATICQPPSTMKKIRLHWSQSPRKAVGLYTAKAGRLHVLDETYWNGSTRERDPARYPFILDGKYSLRSPWFDKRCREAAMESIIAQELEISILGSGSQFFSDQELNLVEKDYCREPFLVGDLEIDPETHLCTKFVESPGGHLRLWTYPDAKGNIPKDRDYACGVDVSMGTGASNSCAAVGDILTRAKVAEYVNPGPNFGPHKFADVVFALTHWFTGKNDEPAYTVWEADGPGRPFGDRLKKDLGHHNIYFHRSEDKLGAKVSDIPGMKTTKSGNKALLEAYGSSIVSGRYIERSHETINECRQFVYGDDGDPVHAKAAACLDPSGARSNHGDRVKASALLVKAMREIALPEPKKGEPEIRPGSLAYRNREHRKLANREEFVF
jgi:hypothetical protein